MAETDEKFLAEFERGMYLTHAKVFHADIARLFALARRGADAADRIAKLEAALEVCDRVLHFDLRKMITWGPDYNQAVKDAANVTRAALGGENE